jgi:hypothetical protein
MERRNNLFAQVIRFVVPWVVRAVILAAQLTSISMRNLIGHLPEDVDNIANQLEASGNNPGLSQFDTAVFSWSRVIAWVMVVAGFILLAHLTVWATNIGFRICFRLIGSLFQALVWAIFGG